MSEKNPLDGIRDRSIPSSSQRGSRATPVWKGPEVDGITQSLLGRFLVCRERFRLLVVEGLKPREGFNHRLGYGDMWHLCEEGLAGGYAMSDILETLARETERLMKKFPFDREKISHWSMVCRTQFPIYVEYWKKHPDTVARTPILQEGVFKVPYRLPSGRTVLLRGKWDGVELLGE